MGTKGFGGIIGRTGIMAIAGGTFSVIGGGKFSNGAFGGAMTHLFNHEIGEAMKTKTQMEQNGRKGLSIGHGKGEKGYYVTDKRGFKYMSDTPEMQQRLDSLKIGLSIPLFGIAVAGGVTTLFAYPFETIVGVGVADNMFMGGTAPNTWRELGATISHDYNPWATK